MLHFTIRPVTETDIEELWVWRNDALTRRMERHDQPVPFNTYHAWMMTLLSDPGRRVLLAENSLNGDPVAVGIFSRRTFAQAEIGLTLNPRYRGLRQSTHLINSFTKLARETLPFDVLSASIRSENIRSRRAFSRAGFKDAGQESHQILRMEWSAVAH